LFVLIGIHVPHSKMHTHVAIKNSIS